MRQQKATYNETWRSMKVAQDEQWRTMRAAHDVSFASIQLMLKQLLNDRST